MQLSVVVPTHDTRLLTLACLDSVTPWLAPGDELIVVDDGSRDGTAQAVRAQHPRALVRCRPDPPHGFTHAANLGLAEARGDILFLLNSDARVEPPGLDPLREAFGARPRLGVAGATLLDPDGSPQWSAGRAPSRLWLAALASGLPAALARQRRRGRPGRPPRPPRAPGARGAAVEWVSGAALAVRRQALADTGPLDTRYAFYAQDLDLCLEAARLGWGVELLEGLRVVHLGGATIGRREGAFADGGHPGLLWPDLLRWAEKHRGRRFARQAALGMVAAASLRRLGRAITRPLVAGPARPARARDDAALAAALAAVCSWRRGHAG